MKRILLLMEHQQNRQALSEWLQGQYEILSPKNNDNFAVEGEQLLIETFDVCFIDFGAVHQLRAKMLAKRKTEAPLFLPFIFLTPLQNVGLSTDHLEPLIDSVVHLPIDKIELKTQLRVLLRSRSYSLQLQASQTELNKALLKEKELNQFKTRFVSTVSHELRNPLNGISGMTQILKAYGDKLAPEKKTEVIAGLQRNVSKMIRLLDDMLKINRTQMGQLQLKKAPLELEKFCRVLISEIKAVFNDKQSINFTYQIEPQQQFNLDQKLLQHILSNLLSNACKYSPDDSVIDFEVRCLNSEIVWVIRDRGIGIPAEDLPQLFDAFYRASNSASYQGTGLGLAIAKEYIELHNGSISVESELDVGTTFTVTIPVK